MNAVIEKKKKSLGMVNVEKAIYILRIFLNSLSSTIF